MPALSYSRLLPASFSSVLGLQSQEFLTQGLLVGVWPIYLGTSPALRSELNSSMAGLFLPFLHFPIKFIRGEINGPDCNFIYLPPSVGCLCCCCILPAVNVIQELALVGGGFEGRNSQWEPEGPLLPLSALS